MLVNSSYSKKDAIIWMIILIVLFFSLTNSNQYLQHYIYTVLALVSYIYCLVVWRRNGNQLISIYTMFVLYMMMSHIGQSLLYCFRFPEEFLDLYHRYSLTEMNSYLKYHMLCSGGMLVGTIFYFSKPERIVENDIRIKALKSQDGQLLNRFDFLLIACCVYVLYGVIMFIVKRQSMDYADFFEQRTVGSFIRSIPSYISSILGLLYVYKNRYRKWIYYFWFICAALYMIGGSRGSAIGFLAKIALTLPLTHSRLFSRGKIIIWIISLTIAFSFLSVISNNRGSKFEFNDALQTDAGISENAAFTMIEMGGSAKTAIMSMNAIESGSMPHYQTNLYFILASVLPASLVQGLGLPDVMLDQWVTDYAGSLYSGLGYSCVAESYVNYGWFGWLWFILYAFFITYAETKIHRNWVNGEFFVSALLAIYLGRAVFYAREQIYFCQSTARFCIYAFIIYYLFFRMKTPQNGVSINH